jgi:hypothetical protein
VATERADPARLDAPDVDEVRELEQARLPVAHRVVERILQPPRTWAQLQEAQVVLL